MCECKIFCNSAVQRCTTKTSEHSLVTIMESSIGKMLYKGQSTKFPIHFCYKPSNDKTNWISSRKGHEGKDVSFFHHWECKTRKILQNFDDFPNSLPRSRESETTWLSHMPSRKFDNDNLWNQTVASFQHICIGNIHENSIETEFIFCFDAHSLISFSKAERKITFCVSLLLATRHRVMPNVINMQRMCCRNWICKCFCFILAEGKKYLHHVICIVKNACHGC